MNTSNLIQVKVLQNESSGYFFKSYDDNKSFVITSKHSICEFRSTCDLIESSVKDCCRTCPLEFDTQKIQLLSNGNDVSLHIENIYYEKAKDLVIVHVTETATNKLIINEKSCSDLYIASGFNSLESGVTNLILDTPRSIDTLIYYNLHSNPTPNLIEKERNFQGISGSVIFTHHENYPTAKALIIHNENHNDFGAESLDTLNFNEINDFFKCKVFDQRLYIPEVQNLKELSHQSLNLIFKTIDGFELFRPKLHSEFEEKLNLGKFIQITGLSGTGKSVFLRQIAESKINDLPFLFIKSDQLTGSNNWLEYLSRVGLPSFSITEWLISLEAVGGVPIVFIDGIDRVSENSKPIIEDLIRTIFNNPDLDNWKIATTLRDTGLEPLKVWISYLLKDTNIQTINIDLLNDDECLALAQKIPSIQQLLFSNSKVKEIIRRPFFTKVVTSLKANDFEPESELELIDAWWKRGGFDETGQSTYNRQDFLKRLSELKSQNLSNSVKRREIQPIDALDSLVVDGIVHVSSKNSTVDFTHDIFYEWSLLYLLLEEEQNWLNKIESFGQPPYISRVVEVLAQREFIDDQWMSHLENPKFKELRSQWLRAWVIGPIGHPKFIELSRGYTQALHEKDFDLFNKLLTWFQAEKTKANPIFLEQPDQLKLAIQHPWPSDALLWRTLLEYIFDLIPNIPHQLFPQVLKIFEVWQYLGTHIPHNPMSIILLDVSIQWLLEISQKEKSSDWGQIVNLKDFKLGLINLILVSTQSNPSYMERYLNFLLSQNEVSKEIYAHIVGASLLISQHHPKLLADLTLKFLLDELPKEHIEREEREHERTHQYFQELLAKPENERTKEEQLKIDRRALFFHQAPYQQIQSHDWENLSIKYESRYFYPSSPLKEPFFSLLKYAEDNGLQLIRDLSNHAIQAWKQQCELSEQAPIPTTIEFPWGVQEFWGNEKQYIWKKPVWINNAISSAYMVLENWCFEQLEQGRNFDELIQKITLGHESVAILCIVNVLALNKQIISNSIFPVVTNFKILELDNYRFKQDLQEPSTTLISFQGESKYQKDIEVVRHNYSREGHKTSLEFLLRNYFINSEFRELTKDKLSNFKADLLFYFENEKTDQTRIKFLEERADFYVEYSNFDNYFSKKIDENRINIFFNHPEHKKQAESEEQRQRNEFVMCSNISIWAKKSFVITSKHSICDQKNSCDPYKNKVDGCCRTCPKEFPIENIHLLQEGTQGKLSITKVFYDKNKDLTIIEVSERATDKLIINEEIYTESYIARGFNEKDKDWINLDLDKPKYFGSMIFYRHLNPNPNLVEKNKNFEGISGSLIFTYHQDDSPKIAKAIIIHNETHNDFGAESLETLDFDYINNFFECHVFHRKKDIDFDGLRLLLQKNQEWLLQSFSNNKAAKHSFGQPLAPNDPNLPKLLPRERLINTIHHNLFIEDINFILGKEGVGKSWVTAQSWLFLENKPLHIFLSAQDFSQLVTSDLENFLIKKIIEQTNDEENQVTFQKWKDVFKKWQNDSI